jgi:hypothetical protein
MRLTLDPNSIADYRTFLRVKQLPVFRIRGSQAWFPDEYADRTHGDGPPIIGAPHQ